MPLMVVCPRCGGDVDVDSDDYRVTCPTCGHRFQ